MLERILTTSADPFYFMLQVEVEVLDDSLMLLRSAVLLIASGGVAIMPVRCERSGGGQEQTNVYGRPLSICSSNPMTGWYRDGYAR